MEGFAPYARILRSPTYGPLWLGQVVSNFGDTLHYVALVVLLFRLTGSGAILAALSLAQIVAALPGGLLLAWGTTPAFLVNAASFAFSALMLSRLARRGRPERGQAPAAPAGFWQEARAGLAYAGGDAFPGPLLLIQGLAALATGGTSALLVVLASRHRRRPASPGCCSPLGRAP